MMTQTPESPVRGEPRTPKQGGRSKLMIGVLAGLLVAVVGVSVVVVARGLRAPTGEEAKSSGRNEGAGKRSNVNEESIDDALAAAATHHRQSEFAQACVIFARVAEQAPTDQRIRLAWAQALLGVKDFSRAYEQYQAAIAIEQGGDAGSASSKVQNNPKVAQLQGEAGSCALLAGMPERAVEHYSMAQTADSTNPRYPLYLAMAQLKIGGEEAETAAKANLVRVTLLDPSISEAWGTLAEIELKKNRVDLAAQHLEKAIANQPGVVKWRLVQARIMNRQGKPEQAVAMLTNLDAEVRRSKPVLTLLGESFGLLEKPELAAQAYEDAAAEAGSSAPESVAEYWYHAALWRQRAGDLSRARKAAGAAAALGYQPAKELTQSLE